VTTKEELLLALEIAKRKSIEDENNVWAKIYIRWFSSALQKIENNVPVPAFTVAAAQGLLLDEKENQK
jgi:hypothetical protein